MPAPSGTKREGGGMSTSIAGERPKRGWQVARGHVPRVGEESVRSGKNGTGER